MPNATLLVRNAKEYPYAAIESGLRARGYDLVPSIRPETDDLLVTWLPWRGTLSDRLGSSYPGDWVVFENGYIPRTADGRRLFSAGLRGHNGWGDHRNLHSSPERWNALFDGAAPKPWHGGDYVLVIGQFGHTDTRYSMPKNWPQEVLEDLRQHTDLPIVYRPKPSRPRLLGAGVPGVTTDMNTPLVEQIQGAHIIVTWNSPSVSVFALMEGTPVVVCGERCVAKGLSNRIEDVNDPWELPGREQFFRDLAYAMWTEEEISEGKLFDHLLRRNEEYGRVSVV